MQQKNPIRYRGYYYDEETALYYLKSRYYDPEIGRFVTIDDISILDFTNQNLNGLNLYVYCNNNPISFNDPTGYLIGLILDIFFLVWSAIDFVLNPSWENAGWLALDLVSLVVPVLTGGSKVVKGIVKGVNGADNLLDATKVSSNILKKADNVVVIGQNMERVKDAAKKIGGGITYKGLNNYEDLVKLLGEDAAFALGYIDNMEWIAKEAWKGRTFLDIGVEWSRLADVTKYANSFKTIKGEKFWYNMVMAGKATVFWGYRLIRSIFGFE